MNSILLRLSKKLDTFSTKKINAQNSKETFSGEDDETAIDSISQCIHTIKAKRQSMIHTYVKKENTCTVTNTYLLLETFTCVYVWI